MSKKSKSSNAFTNGLKKVILTNVIVNNKTIIEVRIEEKNESLISNFVFFFIRAENKIQYNKIITSLKISKNSNLFYCD